MNAKSSRQGSLPRYLKALWMPGIWMGLVGLELAFFADNSRPNAFTDFFERLVFFMSFLFYNAKGIQGYIDQPVKQFLISFSLQFLFWWGVAYWFLLIKDKLTKNGGIK